MNAFARDLGLSSSRLSEILNSKVGISEARAAQIADRLQLSVEEQNLAILELLNVKNVNHTVEEFARYLGLQEEVVQKTLDRLPQLGYIIKEEKSWVAAEPDTTTEADVPSEAIQKYHKQIIGKALNATARDLVTRLCSFQTL